MFSRDLAPEERSVRGSLVVGLSERDMRLLDIFEGDVSAHLSTEEVHPDCGRNTRENWFMSIHWVPWWLSATWTRR